MTTILIILTVILSFAVVFLLWVLRVVLKAEPGFYSDTECIEFAQSVTNHEVDKYDFEQWLTHSSKKVRFSDN